LKIGSEVATDAKIEDSLTAETIEGTALSLQGIHDVE
jgi:hypothetical protein